MKNLVLIVPASAQQECADRLRALSSVGGFTFTSVEGHGARTDHDPAWSPRDRVVGYVPRVRIDVLLDDDAVAGVLNALRGAAGRQSVYWLTNVESHGRLE